MMNTKQNNIATRECSEKDDKIASVRGARGTSVANSGIPMEPKQVSSNFDARRHCVLHVAMCVACALPIPCCISAAPLRVPENTAF